MKKVNFDGKETDKEDITPLSNGELEKVSGGVFTIHDYCINRLEPFYCFEAFWGQCPRLIIDEKRLFFESNPSYGYIYTVSCSKGCFSKERLNSDINR